MASKCFYLIIFFGLFIFSSSVAEILSDFDQYHYIYGINENDESIHKPLVRLVRQSGKPDAAANDKPEVLPEDKTKQPTKKPILAGKTGQVPTPEPVKPKLVIKEKDDPKQKVNTPPPVESHESIHEHDHDHNHDHDHDHDHKDDLIHAVSAHPSSSEQISSEASTTAKQWTKASGPVLTNITVPPDTEIQFNKFFNFDLNETLKEHNISQREDYHVYYNSSFLVDPDLGKKYWVDLDHNHDSKVSDILSKSHRRAVTVKLSFDFPFYGHLIRNITIATGGFLYTGEYVHSWLAATQYIAPLMANFDTSISPHSFVKYLDNGTAFTVQWENVVLQEQPTDGAFTFQCTLFKNGNIVFVYRHVSVIIEKIEDKQHPVKVGLSDAYIFDRTVFFVRRKTIYEYHRVHFNKEDIKNWTVILLNALPTCLDMKTCQSCLSNVTQFECNWCDDRCSNGMDRYRQDWLSKGCEKSKPKICLADEEHSKAGTPSSYAQPSDDGVIILRRKSRIPPPPVPEVLKCNREEKLISNLTNQIPGQNNNSIGIAGIMGILFTISFIVGLSVCLMYAYRNPHSPTGQFLIRYRPSQWSWRRGEARYTAATIHM